MQRNDDVIPRLSRGAGDGVNKMCAMQVVSWQTGDTHITDFPECSARPLAQLVQLVNDRLADKDGFLSPENSVLVLNLGFQTVGTADVSDSVKWQWLSELLVDPEWGVVQYARGDGEVAIRRVAALCVRQAGGEEVSAAEWRDAAAYAYAAAHAAAYAAAHAAAYAAAAAHAAYAASNAAAAAHAAHAAHANAARISHARRAITRWRELAGMDTPTDIDADAVNSALDRIHA